MDKCGCYNDYGIEDLEGSDGVAYDPEEGKYYFVMWYFRDEKNVRGIKYCPDCGRRLGD